MITASMRSVVARISSPRYGAQSDLERALGLSARQVNRVVREFNARYGFNAGTWRDAQNRRRLLVGAALFSQESAKLGEVARAVGYRSETALCRAFANAGLPSPGVIARTVGACSGADRPLP